ncbi:MAG: Ryanodine receptor Ryr [Mogibacterium sp.]|nr:Ryanodine receptor Ryr [Mogibacterium sp.]
MMYDPKPIDLSDVVLPEDLLELTELIAQNVHDVWAASRIKEGWKYGPVKDSEKKETPLLVPYEDLPESEKDYDRNTAFETLKLIVKMGYNITK